MRLDWQMPPTSEDFVTALSNFSSTREKVLEHKFVAEISSCLWARGIFDFAVARSEVDNSGYDLIMEVHSVVRHVQLKASHTLGKTRDVGIQVRLARKPSGCVVWMVHDARTLAVENLLWFGAAAGNALPDLGDKIVKHTKADMQKHKGLRPALREVAKSRFVQVATWQDLTDRLFAPG